MKRLIYRWISARSAAGDPVRQGDERAVRGLVGRSVANEGLGACPSRNGTTAACVDTKKDALRGGRQVVEAGFIQARNLSSSETLIQNQRPTAKPKICVKPRKRLV